MARQRELDAREARMFAAYGMAPPAYRLRVRMKMGARWSWRTAVQSRETQ